MTDVVDIEENDVLESPVNNENSPNIPEIKQEVDDLPDKLTQMPETSQQESALRVEPDSPTGLLVPAELNIEIYDTNNDVTTNSGPRTNETTLECHSDKQSNATYSVYDRDEELLSIESKNKIYEAIKTDSTIALHVPEKLCNNKSLLKALYRNTYVTKETRSFSSLAQYRKNNIKKIALKNRYQRKTNENLNKKVINHVNDIIDTQDTRVNKHDIQRQNHISNKEMNKIMNVKVSIADVKGVLKETGSYCVECERLFFVKNDFVKHRNKEHKSMTRVNWIKKKESSKKEVPVNSIVSCIGLRKAEVNELQYDDANNTSFNSYKTSVLKKTLKGGQDLTASVIPTDKDAVGRKHEQLVKTVFDFVKNENTDIIEYFIKYMNDVFKNKSTDSDIEIACKLRRIEREIEFFALTDDAVASQDGAVTNTSSAINTSSVPINATEKSHYERSTKEKQTICLHCNNNFGSEENLIKHMYEVLTCQYFECKVCMKRFPSRRYLTLRCHLRGCHIKKCQNQNNEQFKITRKLNKIKTLPKDSEDTYYECRNCAKKFTQKRLLDGHSNGLCQKKTIHKCRICEKIFTTKKYLKRHSKRQCCHRNITIARNYAKMALLHTGYITNRIHHGTNNANRVYAGVRKKSTPYVSRLRPENNLSKNKLICDNTNEQENKNGTTSKVIENREEETVPTNAVDLNDFLGKIVDVNAKEEIKISVILDSSSDEESDLVDAKFDKNVAKITGSGQNATETDLVPNSVIFKCQKCPLHFVKCTTAYEHFTRCAVTDTKKTVDCKQCFKTVLEHDIQLHEKQHIIVKDLEVITVKDDSIFQRLLFYCSKCGVNFDEKNFYEHDCDIGREDSIYCAKCDAILDSDLEDHSMWHSKFETDEFTVVCFGNYNEMFWKNNHRIGENSEPQVLGYLLKRE